MVEINEDHLTNDAYGFPAGQTRRVKPIALACLHVTGNADAAAMGRDGAQAERDYANRDDSQASAHYYIARDGWAVEAVDPAKYAAWSNGVVLSPNTASQGIRDVLRLRSAGYNANEAYVLEIESCGGPGYPITAAQKEAVAELVAREAKRTGLAIDRDTVHGHWELNGVNRRNCPVPYAGREAYLAGIIRRANELLAGDTAGEGDMLDFTFLYNAAGQLITGTVTVDDDGTKYLDLSDGQLKPISKGVRKQGVKVRMAKPIVAGQPDTDDWKLGWLIGDNAAFLLDRNATYAPYPAPPPAPKAYPVVVDVGGKQVKGSVELP